jgi:hypothetical protein
MKPAPVVSAILLLAAGLAAGQAPPPVNPNIGHTHHHHRHQEKLATEPAGPQRFVTSRQQAAALVLPAERDVFQFVVFGDRTGGPPEGMAVLADAVRDTNLLAPDLVLTVGDLVQGYTDESQWLVQAAEFKSAMSHLACPWFPVPGNHDVYWRGNDPALRPPRENESLFEAHFGPLWYAFSHKNCWFIVLYSDEGDPQTGKKDFSVPSAQRMSEEQFGWLRDTLGKAKGADHVFLFLHHPRWLKTPGYGNDWDRVHDLLKTAGNVTAVFAGHVHQMRSDGPHDGIEYITLATTGGHLPAQAKAHGLLHHYDLVTVRKEGISLAAIPVGEILDPREMTGAMIAETQQFSRQPLAMTPEIQLAADGSAAASIHLEITNPTTRPVEFTLGPGSGDSRWTFEPDHRHGTLAPGGKARLEFHAARLASPLDASFREPEFTLAADYLAPGYRYSLPDRVLGVPVAFDPAARAAVPDRALHFDGRKDFLKVPAKAADPGETFTLECRFKADSFSDRTGLVTKTEVSDYGLFVNNGVPTFSVYISDSYLSVQAAEPVLKPGVWHHLAGLYDGKEARLYLDGKLLASAAREGRRKRNSLPLIIGGDVGKNGGATSHFAGSIDYVRLSNTARYQGPEASVPGRLHSDPATCLLLQLDELIGLRSPDASPAQAHAERGGNPVPVPNH